MAINKQNIRLIFGLKVKQLRLQKGLSFKSLAEQTGMSVSYLNEIEKGKKYPKADKILLLADALGVSYDQLVSLKLSKKMAPIAELLNSGILESLPLEMFGLEISNLLELISNAPSQINAFISTIIKIARNYEMSQENFYFAALRSYQELHDNYFEDLENKVDRFADEFGLEVEPPVDVEPLVQILKNSYGYQLEEETLGHDPELRQFRSVFVPDQKRLFINHRLTETQRAFLIGKEIAFNYLGLEKRPYTSSIFEVRSFDEVLNNFFASYFSVALLMNRHHMLRDLETFFSKEKWDSQAFLGIMHKYVASPEMFLHRLTNLLSRYFGLDNLFFLRFEEAFGKQEQEYHITKELHFSRLHNPHRNDLNEHYCRRWISVRALEQMREKQLEGKSDEFLVAAQLSSYIDPKSDYFCISIARPNAPTPYTNVSVTLGILVDANSRKKLHFLSDPDIPHRKVNETCERCPLTDCAERAAPPAVDTHRQRQMLIRQRLEELKENREEKEAIG